MESTNLKIDRSKEYILCAAIKRNTPILSKCYYTIAEIENDATIVKYGPNDICDIEIGYRHHDIIQRFGKSVLQICNQGFYTSYGRYVDRKAASKIAYEAGQITKSTAMYSSGDYKDLFSEDIY